jgi:hypothetical protein
MPGPRSRPSRRSVLRGAAGAGAAGIAAAALAGTAGPALAATARPAGPARRDATQPNQAHPEEPIVVHLRDAATGEIDVFRGTSQVRLRDPALAARIVRASR